MHGQCCPFGMPSPSVGELAAPERRNQRLKFRVDALIRLKMPRSVSVSMERMSFGVTPGQVVWMVRASSLARTVGTARVHEAGLL